MTTTTHLKIGIVGAGNMGKTLARKLAQADRDVKVANSRGPDTIEAAALELGARAVTSADAVQGVDVVTLAINPTSYPILPAPQPHFAHVTVAGLSRPWREKQGTYSAILAR